MPWISIDDRLPQLGERVLATDGWFVGEAYRHKAKGWMRACSAYSWQKPTLGTVTHWMPLPKAPYRSADRGRTEGT